MARGLTPQDPSQVFRTRRVNVPDKVGAIWNPLYDYQTLASGGVSVQRFFVDPVGTQSKTLADTNMQLSGQIPKGQAFEITGIQVELYPGVAINGTAASDFADDIYDFYKDGYLVLTIGQKDFVTQGNLMKFAPVNRLALASDSATTATTTTLVAQYAVAAGREFSIANLLLESNQNFSVQLHEINALPSGQSARVGVTLNGFLYRNAQ